MHSSNVVICAAKRSAVGNFCGAFSDVEAHSISVFVIKALLDSVGLGPDCVDELMAGQVLTTLCGQNPARNTALTVGMPEESTATTINQVCGSGLSAIAIASQQILTGQSKLVIAGGHENMTRAPHAASLRHSPKMGNISLIDSMLNDGLMDVFSCTHMGITAETLVKKYGISRAEQDEFALSSHQKANNAAQKGFFDNEIAPVIIEGKKGSVTIDKDESIRPSTSMELLAKLRPAFLSDGTGTVTAGNSSGINDGSAFVIVTSEEFAKAKNLPIMAKIKSFAQVGVKPSIMGIGPISASKKALTKAGWDISDLDLIECNEAFAAQTIAVNREMKWDLNKVNISGGAVALGHPIGASGARIVVTLLHNMKRLQAKKGLATLCVGGGMGLAMCFEAL